MTDRGRPQTDRVQRLIRIDPDQDDWVNKYCAQRRTARSDAFRQFIELLREQHPELVK